MKPIVVVLLDGIGDRGHAALGGRSSNEAAHTPVLDALSRDGSTGLLWPVGPGRAPSSEVAHWTLLGAEAQPFPRRAVFEAIGRGLDVRPGDALGFGALRPTRRDGGRLWVTGRARPEDEEDAARLLDAVRDRAPFTLEPVGRGEAIVRMTGPQATPDVTDTDPFFRDRSPVLAPRALAPAAEPAARALAAWTAAVHAELSTHPVNAARRAAGRPALDVITTKWWGALTPGLATFTDVTGLDGVLLGASPFLRGLATMLGLDTEEAPETDDAQADVAARLDRARAALAAGRDFVFLHLKALDEAGHTKDPATRVRVLERVDAGLATVRDGELADAIVVITGDHATPPSPAVIHSGDPVPFLLLGPGVRADAVDRFGELPFAAGLLGRLHGRDVLPLALNAADRPLFLGSRPTPVRGAIGEPKAPPPLDFA